MHAIQELIQNSVPLAWVVLAAAFFVLAKCADLFVDSAIGLATVFRIPRIVIGIVLVSLATTAPELSVSMLSALRGQPEMALGNAVGSVICDDGLALAMCGICTVSVIPVIPHVLRTSGMFLLLVQGLAFLFVFRDFTLNHWEGAVLVCLFIAYIGFLFREHKRGTFHADAAAEAVSESVHKPLWALAIMLLFGIGGILLASDFIITSATTIAQSFNIPESIIALTLVALGTSIPEVATCITAARKGEGSLAVGNILGADIMNICWVAGASSMANELTLARKELFFMFPAMFAVGAVRMFLLHRGHTMTRRKGFVLLTAYVLYLASFFVVFPPERSQTKDTTTPAVTLPDGGEPDPE